MGSKNKLVSTTKKTDAVNEKTALNSRSEKDIKYDQYRIDHLENPIEGDLQYVRRWEYTIRTLDGKIIHLKRTAKMESLLINMSLFLNQKISPGIYQDIYRIEYLGSEKFKTGKIKKHHFKIQICRFQYANGKFKRIAKISRSTK